MNITNFAKKLAEKPVFKTRIKSDQVKLPEIAIGYFLAPFCAMFANAIFGAYLNRYYVDVLGWTKFGAFATLLPIVSVIFVVLGNLMIGQWIDNTRSTQGKARPYLIIAAPMLIIAIIQMFMTPTKGNNAVQMIWIAVSYNLYYALAYPCFYCAHSSMVSLSTRNSESRGLLATLSNAAMVASAGVGASIVVPILLQSFLFVTKEGGIYGGVQKNIGPAGVVIVIAREDLITDDVLPGTPTMLKWKTQADKDSLYNTPPCYGIYICGKVFKWLKKMGGLEVMKQRNEEKAKILYDYLDSSKLFKGTVVPEDRSLMNVPFVTGDAELDAKFVKEATAAGFVNLKGHRTVGGMRASIYNAMPKEGVEKLVEFMKKFEEENA